MTFTAFDPVVPGVSEDRIVPSRADERVVAAGAVEARAGRRRGSWAAAVDDGEVARREGRSAGQRGDQLRHRRAVAVRVVEELTGARVVHKPVIGVVATVCARSCIETDVPGGEVAGRTDCDHGVAIEL